MRTDGRTDGNDEDNDGFRDFANAPGSRMYIKWAAAVCIVTYNNNNYYYYYHKLVHYISRNNCVSP